MAKSDGVVEPGRKKKREARAAAGTRFVGVRQLASGKFSARIAGHYLGCFPTAEEAAMAYDERALELNGPTARSNFKSEGGGQMFVGVQLRPSGKYGAHIWNGDKEEWLGGHDTAEQAARAYDAAAVRLRGVKAKLNFEPVVSPEGRQEDGPSSAPNMAAGRATR